MVYALGIEYLLYKHGRNVDAIANDFYIKVFKCKNTFHNAHLLKFAVFAEHAHGIGEVSSQTSTCIISALHIFPITIGVSNRSDTVVFHATFEEFFRTRKFRSSVPTLDAVGRSKDFFIFILIRITKSLLIMIP